VLGSSCTSCPTETRQSPGSGREPPFWETLLFELHCGQRHGLISYKHVTHLYHMHVCYTNMYNESIAQWMTTVTAGFTHFFLSLMVLVPQRTSLQKQFSVSTVPFPRSTEETQGPWTHEPHCSLVTSSCLSLVPRINTKMTPFAACARISESRVSHEMAAHSPFMSGTRRIHTKVLCRQVSDGC
jgi:hypothetical protein